MNQTPDHPPNQTPSQTPDQTPDQALNKAADPIPAEELLIEKLVLGQDVLRIARQRFGWSVVRIMQWFEHPRVQELIEGMRRMEETRFDFCLARVRGPVAMQLAELAVDDAAAPETRRKAAEDVMRMDRARKRQARAAAAAKPEPRQEPAPIKAASPPEAAAPPEVAAVPEAAAVPEVPAPPAVAPAAAKQTVASDDDPPVQDDAQAAVSGEPSMDRDVCPTDSLTERPVGSTVAEDVDDRTQLSAPSMHGRGRDSGWKQPRAAAFDAPAYVGGADAHRGVTGAGRRGLFACGRASPRPRPPPRFAAG